MFNPTEATEAELFAKRSLFFKEYHRIFSKF